MVMTVNRMFFIHWHGQSGKTSEFFKQEWNLGYDPLFTSPSTLQYTTER